MEIQKIINSLSLLERTAEQQTIIASMENLQKGNGAAILLKGNSDFGYKLLVREILQANNMEYYHSAFEAKDQAYDVFEKCFSEFFSEFKENLQKQLAKINTLEHRIYHGRTSKITRYLLGKSHHHILDISNKDLYIAFTKHLLEKKKAIILFLEDIQWADNSSLKLLRFLLQSLCKQPILLILTVDLDILDTPDLPMEYLEQNLSVIEQLQLMETQQSHESSGDGVHKFVKEAENNHLLTSLEFSHLQGDIPQKIIKKLLGNSLFSTSFLTKITRLAEGNSFYLGEILLFLSENALSFRGKRWQLKFPENKINLPTHIKLVIGQNLKKLDSHIISELEIAALLPYPISISLWQKNSSLEKEQFEQMLDKCKKFGILMNHSSNSLLFCHDKHRQVLVDLPEDIKKSVFDKVANLAHKESLRANYQAFYWKNSNKSDKALNHFIDAGLAAEELMAYSLSCKIYKEAAKRFPEIRSICSAICRDISCKKPEVKIPDSEILSKFLKLLRFFRIAMFVEPKVPLINIEWQAFFIHLLYKHSPKIIYPHLSLLVRFLSQTHNLKPQVQNNEDVVFLGKILVEHCLASKNYLGKISFLLPFAKNQEQLTNLLAKFLEKYSKTIANKPENFFTKINYSMQAAFFRRQAKDYFHTTRIMHDLIQFCSQNSHQNIGLKHFEAEIYRNLALVYHEKLIREKDDNVAMSAMASYFNASKLQREQTDFSHLSIILLKKALQICNDYELDKGFIEDNLLSAENKLEIFHETEFAHKGIIITNERDFGAAELIAQLAYKEGISVSITTDASAKEDFTFVLTHKYSKNLQDYQDLAMTFEATNQPKIDNINCFIRENEQTLFLINENSPIELFLTTLKFVENNVLCSYVT